MKTLDTPKSSKSPLGALMLLGGAALATTLIARADKQKFIAGAGDLASKVKHGADVIAAKAKPVRFAPNLHAVDAAHDRAAA
ncbi:MAG: hypothetical protein KA104_01495 [Candidatus Pacebacteria bacterium]|nr:hypothetical protein [Candidatus Paceibacterota bacterium]